MVLAACQPALEERPTEPPVMPDATCGAEYMQDRIGKEAALFDFSETNLDRPVRVIPPNSAVTMDYRADRLNVDLDAQGNITRIWCG